jgi:hypothetical protein
MSEIKRWTITSQYDYDIECEETKNGCWVEYPDHKAKVEKLEAENKKLKASDPEAHLAGLVNKLEAEDKKSKLKIRELKKEVKRITNLLINRKEAGE